MEDRYKKVLEKYHMGTPFYIVSRDIPIKAVYPLRIERIEKNCFELYITINDVVLTINLNDDVIKHPNTNYTSSLENATRRSLDINQNYLILLQRNLESIKQEITDCEKTYKTLQTSLDKLKKE